MCVCVRASERENNGDGVNKLRDKRVLCFVALVLW